MTLFCRAGQREDSIDMTCYDCSSAPVNTGIYIYSIRVQKPQKCKLWGLECLIMCLARSDWAIIESFNYGTFQNASQALCVWSNEITSPLLCRCPHSILLSFLLIQPVLLPKCSLFRLFLPISALGISSPCPPSLHSPQAKSSGLETLESKCSFLLVLEGIAFFTHLLHPPEPERYATPVDEPAYLGRKIIQRWKNQPGIQELELQLPTPLQTFCMTLGQLHRASGPQFPHVGNESYDISLPCRGATQAEMLVIMTWPNTVLMGAVIVPRWKWFSSCTVNTTLQLDIKTNWMTDYCYFLSLVIA